MKQFNGVHGCSHCLQSGEQISLDSGGSVHIYPYIQGNPTGPARTDMLTEEHSRKATNEKRLNLELRGLVGCQRCLGIKLLRAIPS